MPVVTSDPDILGGTLVLQSTRVLAGHGANTMSITELLPSVALLPHADKFRLVQVLLEQLAKEGGISLSEPITPSPPVPIGKVYHSKRADVSAKSRSLLFETRAEDALKRRKIC